MARAFERSSKRAHDQHESALQSLRARALRKLRAAAYTRQGVDLARLFRHYDKEHNGELTWSQFRSALRRDAKISVKAVPDTDVSGRSDTWPLLHE